jgi:hypothetical protein
MLMHDATRWLPIGKKLKEDGVKLYTHCFFFVLRCNVDVSCHSAGADWKRTKRRWCQIIHKLFVFLFLQLPE